MATNFSPELLKLLQDAYAPNSSGYSVGTGNAPIIDGLQYQGMTNRGGYAAEGGDGGSSFQNGYLSYKPGTGAEVGEKFNMFDTAGNFQREGQFKEDPWLQNLLIAAAGAFAMGQIPVGAVGGASGGTGGLLSKAALDGTTAFGANSIPGAFALEGAAVPGVFNAAMDSQLANAAMGPEALAGYGGTGGVTGSPVGGGGGSWFDKIFGGGGSGSSSSGLLSSLTGGGGGSDLLGLAATALGGAAGGQGQEAENSSTRRMDPRLDQPVFGDLIPRTQKLLAEQMSPERMAGYRNMQAQGMGLLSQPMAGNGFERFYGGR